MAFRSRHPVLQAAHYNLLKKFLYAGIYEIPAQGSQLHIPDDPSFLPHPD